jgi:hypothetical protein
MTWRAFIIGLLAVGAVCLVDVYAGLAKGYGGLTGSCFPSAPVLALVVLAVFLGPLIKLVRREWAFRQSELMLVWCMVIVGSAIPGDGLGSFWYSVVAGGPYFARRADVQWTSDGSLTFAPDALVLSKDPKSVPARQYFEKSEEGRVPWRVWARPLLSWAAFYVPMFLAVLFMCAILRRQWVESERLMFPLASVPLEFSEGSAEGGLLPGLFSNRAFIGGLVACAVLRFLSAIPLFFGAANPWSISLPLYDMVQGTPLEPMSLDNFSLSYTSIGFGYLVPTDVSLSVWFFFLFARTELLAGRWLAIPSAEGGSWSKLMSWQQLGCNIMFVIGMLYLARRHLWAVVRKALRLSRGDEDAQEPVRYFWAFWGFVLSMAFCVAWHRYFGMPVLLATYGLLLLFCWFLAYARVVAQGGLYIARPMWHLQDAVQSTTGRLGGSGAFLMSAHENMLLYGATIMLAPVAMDSFRISSVFTRRKRLFIVALTCSILVALVATSYMVLKQAYGMGALNFDFTWATSRVPFYVFDWSQRIIKQPSQSAQPYLGCFSLGFVLTAIVMFMRARFYWWPIHPIGLLACNSYAAQRIWVPFLLGWTTKIAIMKLAGGHMLRTVRHFFIAFIIGEVFISGLSTAISTISQGTVPGF